MNILERAVGGLLGGVFGLVGGGIKGIGQGIVETVSLLRPFWEAIRLDNLFISGLIIIGIVGTAIVGVPLVLAGIGAIGGLWGGVKNGAWEGAIAGWRQGPKECLNIGLESFKKGLDYTAAPETPQRAEKEFKGESKKVEKVKEVKVDQQVDQPSERKVSNKSPDPLISPKPEKEKPLEIIPPQNIPIPTALEVKSESSQNPEVKIATTPPLPDPQSANSSTLPPEVKSDTKSDLPPPEVKTSTQKSDLPPAEPEVKPPQKDINKEKKNALTADELEILNSRNPPAPHVVKATSSQESFKSGRSLYLINDEVIKKILESLNGETITWKEKDVSAESKPKYRTMESGTNKFDIHPDKITTSQDDLETFKAMLKSYKASDDKIIPQVTTHSEEAKKLWVQAFKDIYRDVTPTITVNIPKPKEDLTATPQHSAPNNP